MEVNLGTPYLIGYTEGEGVNSLALSTDDKWVVIAGCSPSARVWYTAPRFPIQETFTEALQTFQQEQNPPSLPLKRPADWWHFVNFVACSANDPTVFLGFAGGDIEIWDIASPQPLARYHKDDFVYDGELDALAVSPDERLIVAAGDCPGQIIAWEQSTGACLWQTETYKWAYDLAISPDSQVVAAATWDGQIYLWNAQDGRPLVDDTSWVRWGYPHRGTCFFTLHFSPDGKALALAGVDGNENRGHIHLFDPWAQFHVRELPGHSSGVHTLAFSPDSQLLASGGRDGILRLWNTEGGQQVACFDLGTLAFPTLSEPKHRVIFARRFYPDPNFLPSAIHALAFAKDGGFLVIGTDAGAVIRVDVIREHTQAS